MDENPYAPSQLPSEPATLTDEEPIVAQSVLTWTEFVGVSFVVMVLVLFGGYCWWLAMRHLSWW